MLQRKKPLQRRSALKPRKALGNAPVNNLRGVAKDAVPAGDRDAARLSDAAVGAVWALLKDRDVAGKRFARKHLLGPYLVDLCCLDARLVVDLDGNDPERCAWLRANGYRVLQFDPRTAAEKPQSVVDGIAQAFELRVVSRRD